MSGVHQVVAGAAPHDAITNHVLAARDVIRSMGIASEIFCEAPHLSPALAHEIHPHHEWDARTATEDAAILHYSIDSPAFTHVLDRCARVAIHYHNITPAQFLWRFNPRLARQCSRGRASLASFAKRVSHSASDSQFNSAELSALGFPNPSVVGILRPPLTFARTGTPSPTEPRILFVGRGVPNKAQDDAILAVAALKQVGIQAELRLVGSWGGNEAFEWHCRRLCEVLMIADQVHFLGSVSDASLAHEYASADAFLCLSDHEGYCVPILEALENGLPVLAFSAGAIPETLGSAGWIINDKRPSVTAEGLMAILSGEFSVPVGAVSDRLQHHSIGATADRLTHFVQELLS